MKKFTAILIIIFAFNLIACGKQIPLKEEKVQVDSSQGEIVISAETTDLKNLDITIENFKKIYPNINVVVSEFHEDKIYATDVLFVKNNSIPYLVNKYPEMFLSLNSENKFVSSNFFTPQIMEATGKGEIYGYPWRIKPVAIFYRKDILSNYGINPRDIRTWYDYIEAGKIIKEKSYGAVKMLPIVENGKDDLYAELLNELGSGFTDREGNINVNSNEALIAMNTIKKIIKADIAFYYKDEESLKEAIKSGCIASIPAESGFANYLETNVVEQKGKWGIMRFPCFESGGNSFVTNGGTSIMLNKNSNNPKISMEFAKFAATDEASLDSSFDRYGFMPAYAKLLKSEAIEKENTYFGNEKVLKKFSLYAEDTYANNFTEDYRKINDSLNIAKEDILFKDADTQNVLDILQKKLQEDKLKESTE